MTAHEASGGLIAFSVVATLEMLLAILVTLRSILKEMRR